MQESLADGDHIRVVVVEDDELVRDELGHVVERAERMRCTGVFSSAEEALLRLRESPCDVLLLDIGLPGMAGSDAVPLFHKLAPAMAILMLTVFSDRPKVFASICGGACGYLLKSTSPAQLVEAIRAAHAGGSPLSPEIARMIVELYRKTRPREAPAQLTRQEQRLLVLLSEGHSYETSARQMKVSVNTIRNYVRSVYDKLHVHSKSAAVTTALRLGLIE